METTNQNPVIQEAIEHIVEYLKSKNLGFYVVLHHESGSSSSYIEYSPPYSCLRLVESENGGHILVLQTSENDATASEQILSTANMVFSFRTLLEDSLGRFVGIDEFFKKEFGVTHE